MQNKKGKKFVESENLQSGLDKQGESEVIEYENLNEEKIEVEIREVLRISPKDFLALKNSFDTWVKSWK